MTYSVLCPTLHLRSHAAMGSTLFQSLHSTGCVQREQIFFWDFCGRQNLAILPRGEVHDAKLLYNKEIVDYTLRFMRCANLTCNHVQVCRL